MNSQSAKPPRARDIAGARFEFLKKQSRNPKNLRAFRSIQLKHYECHVENVAKQFGLDSKDASDRELLLRMLAHVHSLRPHTNALQLNEPVPADRRRGGQRKWSTKQEDQQLRCEILKVDPTLTASWPKRAKLLQERFPHRPEYKVERATLEKELRNHFRDRAMIL